jgi:hypothetical protein
VLSGSRNEPQRDGVDEGDGVYARLAAASLAEYQRVQQLPKHRITRPSPAQMLGLCGGGLANAGFKQVAPLMWQQIENVPHPVPGQPGMGNWMVTERAQVPNGR